MTPTPTVRPERLCPTCGKHVIRFGAGPFGGYRFQCPQNHIWNVNDKDWDDYRKEVLAKDDIEK